MCRILIEKKKSLWITYQLKMHLLNGTFLKGEFKNFVSPDELKGC